MSRLAGCAGKRRYPTWAAAERAAERARYEYDCPIDQYRCRYCGHRHIGRPT